MLSNICTELVYILFHFTEFTILWWYEPIYVHRTCLPGNLPWVKELLVWQRRHCTTAPTCLGAPLGCSAHQTSEETWTPPSCWAQDHRATKVAGSPDCHCASTTDLQTCQPVWRLHGSLSGQKSVIVLAITFQSSWQKCIWLCKIQDINKLTPNSWLCSFLLPLSKAHIFWGQRGSDTKWTWHRQKTPYAMNAKISS